jgi:sulfate permease, SulP family
MRHTLAKAICGCVRRLFPFVAWFPLTAAVLRADVIAGITGALVLVPKAMAYAQLSGLPVHFGLYTAFVPAILGAMWGSSRQLATGPVAVVSLMTAAALAPLAVPMGEEYIGLALLLTLMVGCIQLALGVLKLGVIVNFISHPVILGFMNAAAIIIALSQIDMLLGIPKGRSESLLKDVWEMLGYLPQTHLPTLAMSLFALALILVLRRIRALAAPSVLIAVIITILVSYGVGFESRATSTPDRIVDAPSRKVVEDFIEFDRKLAGLRADTVAKAGQLRAAGKTGDAQAAADLRYELELLRLRQQALEARHRVEAGHINRMQLERERDGGGEAPRLFVKGAAPPGIGTDGRVWHVKKVENGEMRLMGGGDVVGRIPPGLPAFRVPPMSLDAVGSLLSVALIIALVAFTESISMAKAMAAKSKQRIDPSQELIGQGVANVGGAFFQSYPACGSFTGSVINLQAGAKTGFAMVFNGMFVAVTLLFLTPYLYHLPKAVLAVIILLAVTSLVTPAALKHTWKASRADGIAALATFAATLLAAPHLDKGILFGAGLAIILYLYRTMRPRVALLARHADGTLRDARLHGLAENERVIVFRFDGELYFANVPYFEDAILSAVAARPGAPYLVVVGDGINEIDASGEEVIRHLVERLRAGGVQVVFSGLKQQVLRVMRDTGLYDLIGEANIFRTEDLALQAMLAKDAANRAR